MAVGQPSRDVRRANFGRFIARALASAKERGMTIPEVHRATGVSSTTIYRWRNGEWSRDPRASEVRGFCEGLRISLAAAHEALGWTDVRIEAEPEPPMDPDVRIVLRRLVDPNASQAEKDTIRATLRYLAELADRTPPRKRQSRKKTA